MRREMEETGFDDPTDPGRVLFACKEDAIALWTDPVVRQILDISAVRPQDQGGL